MMVRLEFYSDTKQIFDRLFKTKSSVNLRPISVEQQVLCQIEHRYLVFRLLKNAYHLHFNGAILDLHRQQGVVAFSLSC